MPSKTRVFHGTDSLAKAKSILRTGFRPGTWFAADLDDSIGYGGLYIFEVLWDTKDLPSNWQWTTPKHIPPNRIISLRKYTEKIIKENPETREKILRSYMTKKEGDLWQQMKTREKGPLSEEEKALISKLSAKEREKYSAMLKKRGVHDV